MKVSPPFKHSADFYIMLYHQPQNCIHFDTYELSVIQSWVCAKTRIWWWQFCNCVLLHFVSDLIPSSKVKTDNYQLDRNSCLHIQIWILHNKLPWKYKECLSILIMWVDEKKPEWPNNLENIDIVCNIHFSLINLTSLDNFSV